MVPLEQTSKQKRSASGITPLSAPQARLMARTCVACSAAAVAQTRSTIAVIKASSCTGGRIEIEKCKHGIDDAGGRGNADALCRSASVETGKGAASFFKNERTSGDVPKINSVFDVAVEAAARGIREIKGGRTADAELLDGGCEACERVVSSRARIICAQTNCQHGIGKLSRGCRMNRAAVAERAAAANGGIQLIAPAVINDANVCHALPRPGDGNSKMRMTMRKVDRAIKGINDPDAGGVKTGRATFFGEEAVIWAVCADHIADKMFRLNIHRELDVVCGTMIRMERAGILGMAMRAAGSARGGTCQRKNRVKIWQGSIHQRTTSMLAEVFVAAGSDMRSGVASGTAR